MSTYVLIWFPNFIAISLEMGKVALVLLSIAWAEANGWVLFGDWNLNRSVDALKSRMLRADSLEKSLEEKHRELEAAHQELERVVHVLEEQVGQDVMLKHLVRDSIINIGRIGRYLSTRHSNSRWTL